MEHNFFPLRTPEEAREYVGPREDEQLVSREPQNAHRREIANKSYHKHSHKRAKAYKDYIAAGKCPKCKGRPLVDGLKVCQVCREKVKLTNQRVTNAIFDHYGWSCACCGENKRKFLSVDHINNDGNLYRRNNGKCNYKFHIYKQAKDSGVWPADLQTLCFNCNMGRYHNGGVCPHRDPSNT